MNRVHQQKPSGEGAGDTSADAAFATRTVAALYARQGKPDQAKRILKRLLQLDPNDQDVQRELDTLEQHKDGTAQSHSHPAAEEGVILELQGEQLLCRWSLSEHIVNRGRSVLGPSAQLVIRLAGFPAPQAICVDVPVELLSDERLFSPPMGASVVTAAVGLRSESGQFIALAHCAKPIVR